MYCKLIAVVNVVHHTLGTLLFVARCFGLVTFLLKSSCNSLLRLLFVQLF